MHSKISGKVFQVGIEVRLQYCDNYQSTCIHNACICKCAFYPILMINHLSRMIFLRIENMKD